MADKEATVNSARLDEIMDSQDQDVLADQKNLEDVKEALEIDALAETLQEFDKNQSAVTRTEDWQFSCLMLDKLLSDEKYEAERQKFFEEIAKNANIDLTEGAENAQSRFETAFNGMTALKKKTFEKISPIAYADLQAELDKEVPIQKSRRMLLDAGVKMPDNATRDEIAESHRIAYAFHQKFGDPSINYEAELKKTAPQINKAFETLTSDKAKKFGMLAVMTAATGGTNLVVKSGIFAVKSFATSERLKNTLSKGVAGFNSFLKSKGVNTAPFEKAMESLDAKKEKAKEKLAGNRWAKGLTTVAVLGAAAGMAYATGDLDVLLDKAAELGNDVLDGKDPNAFGFEGRSATSGFDQAEAPQGEPKINEQLANSPGTEVDIDAQSDVVINEITQQTTELQIESGSSVYEAVKTHLTEVNGMPPSEQAVMQATADILAENGIQDATQVQAGTTFEFRAEDYAYVESVSQETVDIARFGADGIPDGLKGQTVGEIVAGKFDAVGSVETRTTGQLMTEGAINGAIKADLANAVDKGLDPNMTMDDWMAAMEKKVAALDAPAAGSNLAGTITNETMEAAKVPDGHAAPTASAGNENAFENYHERQQHYRSNMGLGQ